MILKNKLCEGPVFKVLLLQAVQVQFIYQNNHIIFNSCMNTLKISGQAYSLSIFFFEKKRTAHSIFVVRHFQPNPLKKSHIL